MIGTPDYISPEAEGEEADHQYQCQRKLREFLDLWKDADRGIAEVEEARERLTGLR